MKRYLQLLLLFVLLSHTAYSQKEELLVAVASNDELDLTDITLITIPTQGPFMLAGNAVYSLIEDNETSAITFPEGLYIENMIWTGKDFAIKSRHEIYLLNDVEKPAFIFNEEDYQIFPWDDERIFVVYKDEGKDKVFMGSLKYKRVKRLVSFDEEVVYVAPVGNATLIVTKENIYMFTDKECIKCLNLWSPINTATMTNKGLVFATQQEICLLTGIDSFTFLFDSGCRQLLFDNKDLYILTDDSDLLKCNINLLEF